MGILNKIFRANTDGLVEANLETYFKVRAMFPTDSVPVDENISMPIQYHAANTAIQARRLPDYTVGKVLGTFMEKIIEAMFLNGKKLYVTEEQLLRSFLQGVFHGENPAADSHSVDAFETAMLEKLPIYARQNAVDLKSRIDLSFLEATGMEFDEVFSAFEKEASDSA